MPITFTAIEIVVADMTTSLAFYRRLGLDLPAGADAQPHVDHVLPGGIKLTWDTAETIASFTPGWTAPTGTPRIALAFECASPHEVDQTYAAMTSADRDADLAPWDAFWGQRYAVVHDPDGNPIDLYAELPVS